MATQQHNTAIFLGPLAALLRHQGEDAAAIFARHGIELAATRAPETRVPVAATHALLSDCVTRLDDPSLGINMARHGEYGSFGALGLALAAGGDLYSVLHRIVRFHRLISDVVNSSLEQHDDSLRITLSASGAHQPHPQAMLFVLAMIVRMVRIRLPECGNPLSVMTPPLAAAEQQAIARYCRCRHETGSGFGVAFARQAARSELAASDAQLAALLDAALAQRLADIERGSLSMRLSLWIEERLPEGEPTLTDAASRLCMSPRSLQRRLKEEQLTWQQLIERTRRVLVERHLRAPGMSITQLAFLLGFADVSSFSRAFRKWYGVSPSQFREPDQASSE